MRLRELQIPQVQPLPGEIVHQRRGAVVGQHPPHLAFEHTRLRERAVLDALEQLVVQNTAPQEERHA